MFKQDIMLNISLTDVKSKESKTGNISHKIRYITRMSRSRKGDRMSAVKVLETTVGGFFSGSLNKCCKDKKNIYAAELLATAVNEI